MLGLPALRHVGFRVADVGGALQELARVYVQDALKRWCGGEAVGLEVQQDGPTLTLRVQVRERETVATLAESFDR